MKHRGRALLALGVAVSAAFGAHALLARDQQRRQAATALDLGESTVSGYRVTGVRYTTAAGSGYASPRLHATSSQYLTSVTFTLGAAPGGTAEPKQVAVSVLDTAGHVTTGQTPARHLVGLHGGPGITSILIWDGTALTLEHSRGCVQVAWSHHRNAGTFTCHWSTPGPASDAPYLATAARLDVTAGN